MQPMQAGICTDSVVIHRADSVAVALTALKAGQRHQGITLLEDIAAGHKFALHDIAEGADIIKYQFPIGHAKMPISAGQWVHTHNCATNLSGILDYTYEPTGAKLALQELPRNGFAGYVRADGRVGIRNELWIIPTVGCVNGTAQRLAAEATKRYGHLAPDGIHCFTHPYGCSQLGGDHDATQRLLAAIVRHPNAGGVLVLGLGCENNHVSAFRAVLGEVDERLVKFLSIQDVEDELEAGLALLAELASRLPQKARTFAPLSKLVVGLKCGGSDGLSGITANPLLGLFSDALTVKGGTTVLTEVPEMFGAEALLLNRCKDVATFAKAVNMVNGYKRYFQRYDQEIYENPSPGNKAGGITTLEEKSLGCTQKGGTGPVVDVLDYADAVRTQGLNLLYGPGNDLCAVTALMATGCQVILFTTGRGTPLGAPVPTIKISTNMALAQRKPHWIDFDAGPLVHGVSRDTLLHGLWQLVLDVAEGQHTRNEEEGYREIAIFKDGVTL